jgi:KDO2-lipid IV(A) lauroyltransferase
MKRPKRRITWLVQSAALILFSLPLALLPHAIAIKAGEILGLLVFYLWKSRRSIAIENIEKSSINSSQPAAILAKDTFKNMGRSLVEVIKIYFGLGKRLVDSVEIRGIENYRKAKAKNKGVIVITGHCGNWEMSAIVFGFKVAPIYGVARKQNNPYFHAFVERLRATYGNRIIYKEGALKTIFSALKKRQNVGILMDQAVLKNEGYIIDFLGRPAWTTKMPALIARRTGAAVLPAFLHREGKGHALTFYPQVELSTNEDDEKAVIEDTKKFSSYIENYIKEHPAEWLWIHRRWKRT